MDKPTDKQTIKSATSNQPSKRQGRKLRGAIVTKFKVSKFTLHNNCCLFNSYNFKKWQYDHWRSRTNTKRENEKAKDDSMNGVDKVDDKVKSLADHEGNHDLEMNGDDGIVPDLPLTSQTESRNGHIGEWNLKASSRCDICFFEICLRTRWRGRTRRGGWSTGSRPPGTNSRALRRRPRRRRETDGGRWKFTLKIKLETSTSMSYRENFVSFTSFFSPC